MRMMTIITGALMALALVASAHAEVRFDPETAKGEMDVTDVAAALGLSVHDVLKNPAWIVFWLEETKTITIFCTAGENSWSGQQQASLLASSFRGGDWGDGTFSGTFTLGGRSADGLRYMNGSGSGPPCINSGTATGETAITYGDQHLYVGIIGGWGEIPVSLNGEVSVSLD